MRQLFLSESRCIGNLMKSGWGESLNSIPSVLAESIDSGRTRDNARFNNDFCLDFVDPSVSNYEHITTSTSILPNSLGPEVFLTVERETFAPMRLELMWGASFPFTYFKDHIALVEHALREALLSWLDIPSPMGSDVAQPERLNLDVSQAISRSAFARVMVVGDDVCFLCFPNHAAPAMRGAAQTIARADTHGIDVLVDGKNIVCLDGWVRTHVPRKDEILVALPTTDD